MDVGIYALQATRYITGEEPVQVTAVETVTDPVKFKDVEETIAWQLKFPGGIVTSSTSTYNFNGMARYQAFAENGWFELSRPMVTAASRAGAVTASRSILESGDQFAAEMDNFAQCILNKQPTQVPGEEGLRDIKIMMAIYEAARTGKSVNLA